LRRKFAVSAVTSVRCEQKAIELADGLDITLSDALMKGILLIAEFKLEHEPGKYTTASHDLFLALQKKNLDEFTEWLGIERLHQTRIAEYAEVVRKRETPQKKIMVYAKDLEDTIEIPEDQFDPEWHVKKVVSP